MRLVLSLLACASLFGANRYVTASAGGAGDGSFANPWTLTQGLTDSNVTDGDVIYIRQGTYLGAFVSNLTGTSGSRITVRNYPGETATLSFSTCTGSDETLEVTGDYTTYQSVYPGEIIIENTCTTRTYAATFRSNGIEIQSGADNNRFIHLVVHDAGMGIVDAGASNEVFGNVIYNNGKLNTSADKQNGHGLYPSNPTGSPLYKDNIIMNNYGWGLHAYGTAITGILVQGNTIGRNGQVNGSDITTNQLMVNDNDSTGGNGNSIDTNYLYRPYGLTASNTVTDLALSDNCSDAGGGHTTTSVTNNVIQGPFGICGFSNPTITGNIIDTTGTVFGALSEVLGGVTSINNNTYRGTNTSGTPNNIILVFPSTYVTLATWQGACGCDGSSTVGNTVSTTDASFIRASTYDTARANLTIFNRDGNNTASVDISSFASTGQFVTIRDGQNWLGAPVWQGVYAGGSITLNLNNTPAVPTGGSGLAADPAFGALVIFKKANPFVKQSVVIQ